MSPVHPAIRAMLVCDLLIRDERTHKVSLIGITEHIHAQQFPLTMQALLSALGATYWHSSRTIVWLAPNHLP